MPEKVTKKSTTKKVATKKTTRRKAPTRTKAAPASKKPNFIPFIAIGVFMVIVGASIAIGFSDNGVIDINATVAERRSQVAPEEQAQFDNIPVQQARKDVPDGGLVPTNNVDSGANTQTPPPAPTPEPTETATSSDESVAEVATSTESTEGDLTDEQAGDEVTEAEAAESEEVSEPEEETQPGV